MTIGSLFSGIGGLELGLEMCGLGPVIWQCDADPCSRIVLEAHWPGVKRYEDVRSIDASAQRPDIICGGFPCQDISNAGKRAGIAGERSGLWFEYARVIRDLRPRLVFIENVAALANRGLDAVLGSLAEMGFDAEWGVFSAAQAGAPHKRDRLFILAHAHGVAGKPWRPDHAGQGARGRNADRGGQRADVAHADGARLEVGSIEPSRAERAPVERGRIQDNPWSAEPGLCPVAYGVPSRVDRLRLLGNAVVPQQAALAWRALVARI